MNNNEQNEEQDLTTHSKNSQNTPQQTQNPQVVQFQQRISIQSKPLTTNNNNQLLQQSANLPIVMPKTNLTQLQIQKEQQQQFKQQIPIQIKPLLTNSNNQQQHIGLIGRNYQQPQLLFGGPKSNINYTDDEMIQPMEINEAVGTYDLDANLEFSVKALYKLGKFNKEQAQFLPAIVTLKAKEVEESNNDKEIPKVGVDLICIIDKSGSMQGEKIQMVMQTLKELLNFLTEKDRLCLVSFNEDAQRLTPLLTASSQNKIKIEKIIDQLKATGGTNISTGTHIAFEQIKKRKYKNKITSIFLLSDGQDDSAEKFVKAQLQKYEEELFTIHTFGFGSDNDAKMMTSLCNLKNGSFYFMKDISLLGGFFVNAIGGLKSVVIENIEISIKLETQAAEMGLNISKTYGNMWEKLNDCNYRIKIPQIAQGTRKDYVFELSLPQVDSLISDNQREVIITNAIMQIKSTSTGQIFSKQSHFNLTFYNENEEIPEEEQDVQQIFILIVMQQYNIIEQGELIRLTMQGSYVNRINFNKLKKEQIRKSQNQKVVQEAEEILQNLQQARLGTIPKNFEDFGQQQMCQMASNNYAQQGINANFNEQGIQQQEIRFKTNQNRLQTNLVTRWQTNII